MEILKCFEYGFVLGLFTFLSPGCNKNACEDPEMARAKEIVSAHRAIFDHPPEQVPSFKIVDGPIVGNGDIGLTVSGAPEEQRFWISKNDFWKSGPHFKQCGPSLIGGIDIQIPELYGATYHIEQVLYEGAILSDFSTGENAVHMEVRVAATDNIILIELKVDSAPVEINLDLWVKEGYGSETDEGKEGSVFWASRKFNTDELLYPSEATISMSGMEGEEGTFTLSPGKPLTIVASVFTNHESPSYQRDAIEKVKGIDHNATKSLIREHNQWWQTFWAKSFIEIEDKLLEKYYYASHYIMACCSRNENFPPGLYGNWITSNRTAWSGDVHLNYNHEAPYWALYSSNRVDLSEPYDAPLLEQLDIFIQDAHKILNISGAYASVGIGPKGLSSRFFDKVGMDSIYGRKFGSGAYESLTGQPMFLGQKSNAIFASMNMILRYHYTYDEAYIRKVYPYLSAVASFWEDYLVFENGRYVIYNDCFHEVGPWQGPGWEEGYGDFNPINSLGFIRVFFNAMMEISEQLGIDQDRNETWKHILKGLSEFPVSMQNGKKQFRAVEGGDGSSLDLLGFQWHMLHGLIFPAPNIGLSSDPEILKMIHQGIDEWGDKTWMTSGNSIQTVLIGAVRVGYDPELLMQIAREKIEKYAYPNLWISAVGGGIETCSAIPGMINEMMLQSHGDIIRVFPVFPIDQKASFYRLRTFGAFLVSGAIENGIIQYVILESEKGRACQIMNPWPGQSVNVYRNGVKSEGFAGEILRFTTEPGEKFTLVPEGKSIDQLF